MLTSHLCQSRQFWQWEWGVPVAGAGRYVLGSCSGLGGTAVRVTKPSPLGSEGGVGVSRAHSPLVPGQPALFDLGTVD